MFGSKMRVYVDPETGELAQPIRYCGDPVADKVTKDSFKDECDINRILKGYMSGKEITHVNEKAAQYADVSELGDYRTAIDNVRAVEELFMSLPAAERAKYDNDPALYLDVIKSSETAKPSPKIPAEVSSKVDTQNADNENATDQGGGEAAGAAVEGG